ncbi:tetratricopeptide repeat protein [Candidatus Uabimicrobium amorphum]|uniref:Tetratricopeptide repeat domain protein n=1 Tax=Uabimicrobium amorphum TaxID=2596890 RepID=A0A5S9IJ20_UABAM|nr:tetratricopeptide repeat protein [Candidatus Uabimicrobium amorphum]BBM82753.1 tetratricopeptide repeat domain protein [Candidatus Uabimicrobium amorphum]
MDIFKQKKAVLFCGAGISLEPPAGLPDWHMLRDYTLSSIANTDSFLQNYTHDLTQIDMIGENDKKGLTPEYVASIILKYCEGYFESFQALEQGEPNINHLYLAKLAEKGYLKYIVTTNFDVFIETALQKSSIPHKVYSSDEHFANFDSKDTTNVHLLKLHGCIRTPQTITATVEQESQGLSSVKKRVLQQLLREYYFAFWGYSGADLKINLDYLAMESSVKDAQGFVWNFLQKDDHKETINPHVQKLVKLYDKKGQITHGKFPQVFTEILGEQLPHHTYSEEQQHRLIEHKNEQLHVALDQWAQKHVDIPSAFSIIGRLLRHSGQIEKAFACYLKMTEIIDEKDNYAFVANAYNEMGYLQKVRSYYDEALDFFCKAQQIAAKNKDLRLEAEYLNSIGGIYRVRRNYTQALGYYQKAVDIAQSISDQKGLAFYLNKLGGLYKSMGRRSQALDYLKQAKELCVTIGDEQGLAINLDNIGKIYRDEKDYDTALEYFLEAERITRLLGDKQGIAVRLSSLGGIYKRNSQTRHKALDCYLQAMEIAQDLGDRRGSLLHSQNAASVYLRLKQYNKAVEHYKLAVEIAEDLKDTKNTAQLNRALGNIFHFDLQRNSAARDCYTKSLESYQTLGWQREINEIRRFLRKLT